LAIDSDIELANSEAVAWAKHGIEMDRVDNMVEAIQRLMYNDDYIYIGINSDAVDCMPLLNMMASITNTPILIATSTFTMEKQAAAMDKGADLYGPYGETKDNASVVLAAVNQINSRAKQRKNSSGIIVHGDIIVNIDRHQFFIKNDEITLSRIEMETLHFLLSHRGLVVRHKQLHNHIWPNDEIYSQENLYNTVRRLRDKMAAVSSVEYIENIKDVGYRIYKF
jgi:DNA-binding response OmpR family regulator